MTQNLGSGSHWPKRAPQQLCPKPWACAHANQAKRPLTGRVTLAATALAPAEISLHALLSLVIFPKQSRSRSGFGEGCRSGDHLIWMTKRPSDHGRDPGEPPGGPATVRSSRRPCYGTNQKQKWRGVMPCSRFSGGQPTGQLGPAVLYGGGEPRYLLLRCQQPVVAIASSPSSFS